MIGPKMQEMANKAVEKYGWESKKDYIRHVGIVVKLKRESETISNAIDIDAVEKSYEKVIDGLYDQIKQLKEELKAERSTINEINSWYKIHKRDDGEVAFELSFSAIQNRKVNLE